MNALLENQEGEKVRYTRWCCYGAETGTVKVADRGEETGRRCCVREGEELEMQRLDVQLVFVALTLPFTYYLLHNICRDEGDLWLIGVE